MTTIGDHVFKDVRETPTPDELCNIEAIRRLKAKYWRYVDTKQWDRLESLFVKDAIIDYGIGPPGRFRTAASLREFLAEWAAGMTTVHHGHMAEIEVTDVARAVGVWAVMDYVTPTHGPGPAFTGYGHYHEVYQRDVHGVWYIAELRLTRLRVDSYTFEGHVSIQGDEATLD